MTAILKRLTSRGITLPLCCVQNSKEWSFARAITEQNPDFFRPLVWDHAVLNFEYSVHCTLLTNRLKKADATEISATEIESLEIALMLAELLEQVYLRPELSVSTEVKQLRKEQDLYRRWLENAGYTFLNHEKLKVPLSVGAIIRNTTANMNWTRLFILRTRRLLIISTVVANNIESFGHWMSRIDKHVAPVVSYVAWVFFLPRLLTNLIWMGKHLMPDKKHILNLGERFRVQMESRGFELANDAAWFTSGILNCFMLVGLLSPFSFYAAVALQTYDLVLAILRARIEIKRLQTLADDYRALLQNAALSTGTENQPSLTPTEQSEIQTYLNNLEQRIQYEQKRLYLQVASTVVLFVAAILAMPILVVNPIIPLIGASLAVLVTLLVYLEMKRMDRKKPAAKVPEIGSKAVSHRFFKPIPSTIEPIDADSPPINDHDGTTGETPYQSSLVAT